jgi:hypothetical protein
LCQLQTANLHYRTGWLDLVKDNLTDVTRYILLLTLECMKKKKKKKSTYIILSSNCTCELINPAFLSLNYIGIYENVVMDDCSANMSIGEHIKIVTMIHPATPDIYGMEQRQACIAVM